MKAFFPSAAGRLAGRFSILLLLSLLAAPAWGQDLAEKIELCTSCHGEKGLPSDPDVPIIWGQEFYYLYVQLKDYKAGRRHNEIMTEMVAKLDKAEMRALAQHFSELPWPAIPFRSDESDRNKGETIATGGQCPQCHLDAYLGDSRIPRLAGQQPRYLERTMLDLKNRVRKNAPDIGTLLRDNSDEDIRAMARFLAGL